VGRCSINNGDIIHGEGEGEGEREGKRIEATRRGDEREAV
jgi:hypothetical protein